MGKVRARRVLFGLAIGTLVPVSYWGCTYLPDQNYGDPTGLRSTNLPGEAGVLLAEACEAGLPPRPGAVDASADAGADDGDDGGDAGDDGGDAGDDGGCAVSFALDLYPRILSGGSWGCAATSCHGGSQTPTIDPTSPTTVLASLRAYTIDEMPYIAAPSVSGPGDPSQSAIYCNLMRTCGQAMPPSTPVTAQELCALQVWLTCGAPSN